MCYMRDLASHGDDVVSFLAVSLLVLDSLKPVSISAKVDNACIISRDTCCLATQFSKISVSRGDPLISNVL